MHENCLVYKPKNKYGKLLDQSKQTCLPQVVRLGEFDEGQSVMQIFVFELRSLFVYKHSYFDLA